MPGEYPPNDYSRFDVIDYNDCGCNARYCDYSPFASYDADGVLMDFQVNGLFAKEGSWPDNPEESTRPYYYNAAPCCYELTITGVSSPSRSDSWCQSCESLNGSYDGMILNGAFRNVNGWCGLDRYCYHNQNPTHSFMLCNADTTLTEINPAEEARTEDYYYKCGFLEVIFYVNVEESAIEDAPPEIVAYAWLCGEGIYNNHYTFSPWYVGGTEYHNCIYAGWRRIIAEYDGDYDAYIDRYDTFLNPNNNWINHDHGTYDGREFSVQFNSNHLITDYTSYSGSIPGWQDGTSYVFYDYLILDDVCHFGSTTLDIHPLPENNTFDSDSACFDSQAIPVNGICQEHVYSSGLTSLYDWGGEPEFWSTAEIGMISNGVQVTISNVDGIDDDKSDEDIYNSDEPIRACKKCNVINDTFHLDFTGSDYGETGGGGGIGGLSNYWIFSNYGRYGMQWNTEDPYQGVWLEAQMCCDCMGSSTCLYGLHLELVKESGYPAVDSINTVARLDVLATTNQYAGSYFGSEIVARYEKILDASPLGDDEYRVDCDGLYLNDFTYVSGVAADEDTWQRCNFDKAEIEIQTLPYNTPLQTNCLRPELSCGHCVNDEVPALVATLPSITHIGPICPYPLNRTLCWPYDCPEIGGEYVLDFLPNTRFAVTSGSNYATGCVWQYTSDIEALCPGQGSSYHTHDGNCTYREWAGNATGCNFTITYTVFRQVNDPNVYGVLRLNLGISWGGILTNYNNANFQLDTDYSNPYLPIHTAQPANYTDCLAIDETLPVLSDGLPYFIECYGWGAIPPCLTQEFKEWQFDGSSASIAVL